MIPVASSVLLVLAVLAQEAPQTAADLYYAGRDQALQGKMEEAKESYRRARELDPTFPWPVFGLAEILWKENRPNKAVETVSKAIELAKDDPGGRIPFHLLRASIQFELGFLDKTEADLTVVLESDSTVSEAHNLLAQVYIAKGRFDDAVKEGMALVSLEERVDDGYYLIGNALFKKGNLSGAEKILRKATKLNPRHTQARYVLAQVLMRMDREEEAEAELELHKRLQAAQYRVDHALEQAPRGKCVHCWRILSVAFGELGRFEEARVYALKVLEERADEPEALFVLGYIQSELGEWKEAVKTYRRAIEVKPDYIPPYNNLAWLLAAVEEVKDPDEAVRLAERTVELGGALPEVLAEAYFSQGDKAKAERILQDAVEKGLPSATRCRERLERLRRSEAGPKRSAAVGPPAQPEEAGEPHKEE